MPSLVSVSFSTARAPWHVKEKFPFFFFFGISLGLECSLWGWAALWEAGPGSSVVSPVKSGTWCQLTGHSPNLRLCILQFPFYLECSERLREVHQGRELQALSPAELVSICTQPAGIAPFQSLPAHQGEKLKMFRQLLTPRSQWRVWAVAEFLMLLLHLLRFYLTSGGILSHGK